MAIVSVYSFPTFNHCFEYQYPLYFEAINGAIHSFIHSFIHRSFAHFGWNRKSRINFKIPFSSCDVLAIQLIIGFERGKGSMIKRNTNIGIINWSVGLVGWSGRSVGRSVRLAIIISIDSFEIDFLDREKCGLVRGRGKGGGENEADGSNWSGLDSRSFSRPPDWLVSLDSLTTSFRFHSFSIFLLLPAISNSRRLYRT